MDFIKEPPKKFEEILDYAYNPGFAELPPLKEFRKDFKTIYG